MNMSSVERYTPIVSGGTFGVSCIFPTLQDIIDYEEKRRVPTQGYPRFIPHPYVAAVQDKHKKTGHKAFAVQSEHAAWHIFNNYFSVELQENCHIETFDVNNNLYAIISVAEPFAKQAGEDICNAGIILSARKANRILNKIPSPDSANNLPNQLSMLEKGSTPELTFIFNSGMSAIYAVVQSFLKPGKSAVVIGSCYTDSYRIFSKLPTRFPFKPTVFLSGFNNEDFPDDTGIVFLEIPSNPLLKVENIELILKKAHKTGALVIVDSTIATPWHFSPLELGVDLVVHSTSKALSGKNNHMGGVLFINPKNEVLTTDLNFAPFTMDVDEAEILALNLTDFHKRITRMEENAGDVLKLLLWHPEVEKVFYPEGLQHGDGHVISFTLKNENFERACAFYDNCTLEVKGPSMGYEKTMLMPYSVMTRYFDTTDELKSSGLTRYLMRLSVGTEDTDEIISHLTNGLNSLKKIETHFIRYS